MISGSYLFLFFCCFFYHPFFHLYKFIGYFIDYVTRLARDQNGSRLIQAKLEEATAWERDCILVGIAPRALQLMCDPFGNYVIQKLLEFGTPDQRSGVAELMRRNVVALSYDLYGCRVVQTAIQNLPRYLQVSKKLLVNQISTRDQIIFRTRVNKYGDALYTLIKIKINSEISDLNEHMSTQEV